MVIVVRCCRWGAHRAPNQCDAAQQERDTADCAGRREISEAIYSLTATAREHPGPPCFHAGCPTSDATNACNAITTCHRSAARVDAPTLPRHSRQPRKTRALRGCGCCEGWCREEESNLRPTHYECAALPTELSRHRAANFTVRGATVQARALRIHPVHTHRRTPASLTPCRVGRCGGACRCHIRRRQRRRPIPDCCRRNAIPWVARR